VVLVGTFVAEKILDTFIGHVGAFLPYGLLDPLLGLSRATISHGAAAEALTATVAVLVLVGGVLLRRRDVISPSTHARWRLRGGSRRRRTAAGRAYALASQPYG